MQTTLERENMKAKINSALGNVTRCRTEADEAMKKLKDALVDLGIVIQSASVEAKEMMRALENGGCHK